MNITTRNMTDITDLSDVALDVFMLVKAGDENVDCDHLTIDERASVCAALGVEMPYSWRQDSSADREDRASRRRWCAPRDHGRDYETAILARQDRYFED